MAEFPKKMILIADDDDDLSKVICDFLEVKGFATLVVRDGISAINAVKKEKPDLILLDLVMPAGSGVTVLDTLKFTPFLKEEIPVIVMTSLRDPEIKPLVQGIGAQDFLHKPFRMEALLEKVRKFL